VAVEREGEHRAAGDIQRHALHGFAQVRRPVLSLQLSDHVVGGRQHVRHQHRHRARRKRRRQRAALMLPGLPRREQQPFLAEDRPQHTEADMGAAVVFVIVDQDALDRLRRVDGEAVAAKKAALDDVFAIGPLAPGIDGAAAHPADAGEGGKALRSVVRTRWADRGAARRINRFGNAHAWPLCSNRNRKLGGALDFWQQIVHHRRLCPISAAIGLRLRCNLT
jgi:hypothetical protein